MTVAYRARAQRALMISFCLTAGLAAACSVPEVSERRRSTKKTIVNGQASTAPEDEGVVLLSASNMICSATLIAPNLILTARHCVADGQGSGQCTLPPTDQPASNFAVSLGQQPKIANAVARGTRIFAPPNSTLCGADVALIQLDRNVAAPVRKVRFTPVVQGEGVVAVGYGKNENEQLTGRNMRGGLSIRSIGPSNPTATDQSGFSFQYDLPAGDIATGESTCQGDSGGPLFDSAGRLVGVTSRGVTGTCLSGPAIYAGVAVHADLIRSAAVQAGHPLVEGSTPDGGAAADAGPPQRPPTTSEADAGAGAEAPAADSGVYLPPSQTGPAPESKPEKEGDKTKNGDKVEDGKSESESESDSESSSESAKKNKDDHDHDDDDDDDDSSGFRDQVEAENMRASAGCAMNGSAYSTTSQFNDSAFITILALVTALAFVRSKRSA